MKKTELKKLIKEIITEISDDELTPYDSKNFTHMTSNDKSDTEKYNVGDIISFEWSTKGGAAPIKYTGKVIDNSNWDKLTVTIIGYQKFDGVKVGDKLQIYVGNVIRKIG
jgi:hypothetical protein